MQNITVTFDCGAEVTGPLVTIGQFMAVVQDSYATIMKLREEEDDEQEEDEQEDDEQEYDGPLAGIADLIIRTLLKKQEDDKG